MDFASVIPALFTSPVSWCCGSLRCEDDIVDDRYCGHLVDTKIQREDRIGSMLIVTVVVGDMEGEFRCLMGGDLERNLLRLPGIK